MAFRKEGPYAYLARAGVLPAHSGKGLYKRMIRLGLKHYKGLGFEQCVTDCTNWNIASARGLMGVGFKPYWPMAPWSFTYAIYWIINI